MKTKILLIILLFLSLSVNGQNNSDFEAVSKIHSKILKIDTHLDTPLRLLDTNFRFSERNNLLFKRSKVDLPRILEGKMNSLFFAAFVPQSDRTDSNYAKGKESIIRLVREISKVIRYNSEYLSSAETPDQIIRSFDNNKVSILCGIENGFALGKDKSLIKYYYDLGVRYITLCHTKNNDICDSSTDPSGEEHKGLSSFGKEVISEMNKKGMLIDLSHVSDKAALDVLQISSAPVFVSHTCCRSIANNPRNVPDEVIQKIKENGGVVQICIYSGYLKDAAPDPVRDSLFTELKNKYGDINTLPDSVKARARAEWYEIKERFTPELATVKDAVDHIEHVIKIAGIDYVGIGTDFDGGGELEDCRDISQMGNITSELIKRGYSEKDIRKIWGDNFLRVFREAEEARSE